MMPPFYARLHKANTDSWLTTLLPTHMTFDIAKAYCQNVYWGWELVAVSEEKWDMDMIVETV